MNRQNSEVLHSKIREYVTDKTTNTLIHSLLEKHFYSFFPDRAAFFIDKQITDKDKLCILSNSSVDSIFYRTIVDDVSVHRDKNLLTKISAEGGCTSAPLRESLHDCGADGQATAQEASIPQKATRAGMETYVWR